MTLAVAGLQPSDALVLRRRQALEADTPTVDGGGESIRVAADQNETGSFRWFLERFQHRVCGIPIHRVRTDNEDDLTPVRLRRGEKCFGKCPCRVDTDLLAGFAFLTGSRRLQIALRV